MSSLVVPRLPPRRAALIGAGAVAGAGIRWASAEHLLSTGGSFPWATFVVNVVGSALLGWALVEARRHPDKESILIDGVGTGFCGGLTTFSAFAVEAATLGRDGETTISAVYVLATVAAGLLAATTAITLARRLRGGTPP